MTETRQTMRQLFLIGTHAAMLALGFALGVYFLPILTAPEGPDDATLAASAEGAMFSAEFTRDLRGSDFLHWGEGRVQITQTRIVHSGTLAPGPDYMVYLVPDFVEDEADFELLRSSALRIGPVKTFDGFILDLPPGTDPAAYTTVLVWCEAFGEFITAAKYR
jgi:hypothetical protein